MKRKIIVVMTLLAAVLVGCKDFRPGVPEAYWDYFPYEVGDTISFSNGRDLLICCVTYKYVDEDREVPHRFIQCCEDMYLPELNFESRGEDDNFTDKKRELEITGRLIMCSDNLKEAQIQVRMRGVHGVGEEVFVGNLAKDTFPDEIVLQPVNTVRETFLESVIVRKGIGIYSFIERESGKVWARNSNHIKNRML